MKAFFISVMIISLFSGCYYDKADLVYPASSVCDTTSVSYSKTVLPVLSANCYVCHSGTASAGSGIKLDSYANLSVYVANSQFLNSIIQSGKVPGMPLNAAKLSTCEISQINAWINTGAPNN